MRGILSEREVELARHHGYIQGVHVVVATPQALISMYSKGEPVHVLQHIKVRHVVGLRSSMGQAGSVMEYG